LLLLDLVIMFLLTMPVSVAAEVDQASTYSHAEYPKLLVLLAPYLLESTDDDFDASVNPDTLTVVFVINL
jgi:hypothetical protein